LALHGQQRTDRAVGALRLDQPGLAQRLHGVDALAQHRRRLAENPRRLIPHRSLTLHTCLQPLERLLELALYQRGGRAVGQRAQNAAARRLVAEPQLDVRAAVLLVRAQPPAPALVDALDAGPRHVAVLVPLDDLDRRSDLG
jgi:hypothetical protein